MAKSNKNKGGEKKNADEKEVKLTFGQKAVGITFNPSADSRVDRVKQQYANIIDDIHTMRTESDSSVQKHLSEVTIQNAISAQMWAVKAITAVK